MNHKEILWFTGTIIVVACIMSQIANFDLFESLMYVLILDVAYNIHFKK